MDSLNGGNGMRSRGLSIIDFDRLTTIKYSDDTGEFACHVTAEFSDGDKVSGVISKRKSHTGFVVGFEPDAAKHR